MDNFDINEWKYNYRKDLLKENMEDFLKTLDNDEFDLTNLVKNQDVDEKDPDADLGEPVVEPKVDVYDDDEDLDDYFKAKDVKGFFKRMKAKGIRKRQAQNVAAMIKKIESGEHIDWDEVQRKIAAQNDDPKDILDDPWMVDFLRRRGYDA